MLNLLTSSRDEKMIVLTEKFAMLRKAVDAREVELSENIMDLYTPVLNKLTKIKSDIEEISQHNTSAMCTLETSSCSTLQEKI